MKTYQEYQKEQLEGISKLPLFYAFSQKQFKEAMEERGLTEDDTDQIYRLGDTGGFYLRKDADVIRAWFNRKDELSELMKDYKFAYEAIKYEMANHEYHINWQADWDVCSCFGKVKYTEENDELNQYWEQLGWSDTTRSAYVHARHDFLKEADENGWA